MTPPGTDARSRAILDHMIDGLVTTSEAGTIEFANPAAERLFGQDPGGMIGRPFRQFLDLPPGDDEAFLRSQPRHAAGQVTSWTGVRRDGSLFPLELSLFSYAAEDGARRFASTIRDVTERHEIDRMKDEFISVVSHELRTPLTSIRGAIQIVLGGEPQFADEEHAPLLKIALNNCERLIRIINDILDVSKIESGQMELKRRACNVAELAQTAFESVTQMAASAGVRLEMDVAPSLWVAGDFDRLVQVLVNLLSNAAKFSPPGATVTLRARPDEAVVEIAVIDRGRGIKPENLSRLFRKFQQVDSSPTRRAGGTGLGLALVKALVEQHGGTAHVESRLNEGSVFSVRLPATAPPAGTGVSGVPAGGAAAGRTVLIVDDDRDIRQVIRMHLEQAGYRVIEASDGAEAVRLAIDERPDLITMDLLMPGTGGLVAMRELSADLRTTDIPVVVVSALTDTVRVDRAAAVIAKPARFEHLLRELTRLAGTSAKPTVLLAEDDADLRAVLTRQLTAHGLTVLAAVDGGQACALFDQHPCDLVLLDLYMPERDGFQVIAHVRESGRLPPVPIVVMSGSDSGNGEVRSLEIGANAFFAKPVDVGAVLREITALVARGRQ